MSDFCTNPLKVTRVFQLAAVTFLVETLFPNFALYCVAVVGWQKFKTVSSIVKVVMLF